MSAQVSSQTSASQQKQSNSQGRFAAILIASCAALVAVALSTSQSPSSVQVFNDNVDSAGLNMTVPEQDEKVGMRTSPVTPMSNLEPQPGFGARKSFEDQMVDDSLIDDLTSPSQPLTDAAATGRETDKSVFQKLFGCLAWFFNAIGTAMQRVLHLQCNLSEVLMSLFMTAGLAWLMTFIITTIAGSADDRNFDDRQKTGQFLAHGIEKWKYHGTTVAGKIGLGAFAFILCERAREMAHGYKKTTKTETNEKAAAKTPAAFSFTYFALGKLFMLVRLAVTYLGVAKVFSFADFLTFFTVSETILICFAGCCSFPLAKLAKPVRYQSKAEKRCALSYVLLIDFLKSILQAVPALLIIYNMFGQSHTDNMILHCGDKLGFRYLFTILGNTAGLDNLDDLSVASDHITGGQIAAFLFVHGVMDLLQSKVTVKLNDIWKGRCGPGRDCWGVTNQKARCLIMCGERDGCFGNSNCCCVKFCDGSITILHQFEAIWLKNCVRSTHSECGCCSTPATSESLDEDIKHLAGVNNVDDAGCISLLNSLGCVPCCCGAWNSTCNSTLGCIKRVLCMDGAATCCSCLLCKDGCCRVESMPENDFRSFEEVRDDLAKEAELEKKEQRKNKGCCSWGNVKFQWIAKFLAFLWIGFQCIDQLGPFFRRNVFSDVSSSKNVGGNAFLEHTPELITLFKTIIGHTSGKIVTETYAQDGKIVDVFNPAKGKDYTNSHISDMQGSEWVGAHYKNTA